MPANESSLRVNLRGKFHSKTIYQKCLFNYKYWKRLLVKKLLVKNKQNKISFDPASTTSQTNICREFYF